jgi:hypothetical protein
MGCGASAHATAKPEGKYTYDEGDAKCFVLQHPGTCTGMFWRDAPDAALTHRIGDGGGGEKPSWPRNGSVLRGIVRTGVAGGPGKPDETWLEVVEYVQDRRSKWTPTPGCWMPFDQGGTLLHPY